MIESKKKAQNLITDHRQKLCQMENSFRKRKGFSVGKMYKEISFKVIYFLKSYHLGLSFRPLLKKEIQISLKILLSSYQDINISVAQFFSLFLYLQKKYKTWIHQPVFFYELALKLRHKDFQVKSQSPQMITLNEHSKQLGSLNIIINQNISSDKMQEDSTSQIIPEMTIFLKFLYNTNNSVVIKFRGITKYDKQLLSRLFNGICNEGGGIVIIGILKSIINYDPELKINNFSKSIQEIIINFCKINQKDIFRVLQIEQSKPIIKDDNQRIFYQVIIRPKNELRLNFLFYQQEIKFKRRYVFHVLNKKIQPIQVSSQFESIYDLIHKDYQIKKNYKKKQNLLEKIPVQPSVIFCKNSQTQQLHKQKQHSQYQKQQRRYKTQNNYLFTSYSSNILLVLKKKEERELEIFLDSLKANKYEVHIWQPYPGLFNYGQDEGVHILSHSDKYSYSELKLILKICQQQERIKVGSIRMIQPFHALQIDSQIFPVQLRNVLKQKFHEYFHKQIFIKIQETIYKQARKQLVVLQFDQVSQSIFGFMVLLQFKIVASFLKQSLSDSKKVV